MPVITDGTFQLGIDSFTGDFKTPDGFNVRLHGSFIPSIPPGLQVPKLELTYESLSDFGHVYNFTTPTSFVGQATINILGISSSAKEFTITGSLVPPLPNPTPLPINGTARWVLS